MDSKIASLYEVKRRITQHRNPRKEVIQKRYIVEDVLSILEDEREFVEFIFEPNRKGL